MPVKTHEFSSILSAIDHIQAVKLQAVHSPETIPVIGFSTTPEQNCLARIFDPCTELKYVLYDVISDENTGKKLSPKLLYAKILMPYDGKQTVLSASRYFWYNILPSTIRNRLYDFFNKNKDLIQNHKENVPHKFVHDFLKPTFDETYQFFTRVYPNHSATTLFEYTDYFITGIVMNARHVNLGFGEIINQVAISYNDFKTANDYFYKLSASTLAKLAQEIQLFTGCHTGDNHTMKEKLFNNLLCFKFIELANDVREKKPGLSEVQLHYIVKYLLKWILDSVNKQLSSYHRSILNSAYRDFMIRFESILPNGQESIERGGNIYLYTTEQLDVAFDFSPLISPDVNCSFSSSSDCSGKSSPFTLRSRTNSQSSSRAATLGSAIRHSSLYSKISNVQPSRRIASTTSVDADPHETVEVKLSLPVSRPEKTTIIRLS